MVLTVTLLATTLGLRTQRISVAIHGVARHATNCWRGRVNATLKQLVQHHSTTTAHDIKEGMRTHRHNTN
eukprot:3973443-Alexandrium_andersonii.AAC.1